MPSRKVADAHVQFSAEGIPALTSAVKKLHGDLSSLSATAGAGGLFGTNFAKDIAQLDKVQRELKKNIQLKNQLMATEVQASLAADRTSARRAAQDRARGRIAQVGVRQVMASPTLQKAQKDSSTLDFRELVKQRAETRKLINDPNSPVSGQFRKKADTVAGLRQDPAALRRSAAEIRNTLNSIKSFGPAGSKTKAAVDEVKQRMRAMADGAEALADRMEKLDQVIKRGAALTPEQRGRIRGNTRDELRSGERVDAITQRQAAREEQSLSGRTLLNRRFSEIAETPDLTDRQKSNEQALAAKEVASTLRALAQDIRESKVDEALRNAANRLRAGEITPGAFRSEVAKAEAQQVGAASAGSIAEDVNFRSKTGGASKDTVAMRQEAETLRSSKEGIDKLIAANSNLTAEEKKRLAVESELLAAEIKSSESRASISEEMDKVQAATKKSMSIERDFQERVEKGEKLSKKDAAARKANKKEIDKQGRAYQDLNKKLGGFNNDMHSAAGSSRRFNFMIQQASFGVQDFVQVIGQTGFSGALRASANNMASVAAATGKVGGALVGALGTIAMIGFATALEKMGGEAESTAEKVEKLNKKLEVMQQIRIKANELTTSISASLPGRGDLGLGAFRSSASDAERLRMERVGIRDTASQQGGRVLEEQQAQSVMENIGRAIYHTLSIGFDPEAIVDAGRGGSTPEESQALKKQELEEQFRIIKTGLFLSQDEMRDVVDQYQSLMSNVVNVNSEIGEGAARAALALEPGNEELQKIVADIDANNKKMIAASARADRSLSNYQESLREYVERTNRRIASGEVTGISAIDTLGTSSVSMRADISATRTRLAGVDPASEDATQLRATLERQEAALAAIVVAMGGIIDKQGTQDDTGMTSVASLHSKIQESLTGGDSEKSMSEKRNELLQEIADHTRETQRIKDETAKPKSGERPATVPSKASEFPQYPGIGTGGMMSVAPPQFPYSKPKNEAGSLEFLLGFKDAAPKGSKNPLGSPFNDKALGFFTDDSPLVRGRAPRTAAQRSVERQGYSDFLGAGQVDRSADAFYGARRGGTVSDSPAQRRGVVDEASTFGRRFSGSAANVPASAAEELRRAQGLATAPNAPRAAGSGVLASSGPGLKPESLEETAREAAFARAGESAEAAGIPQLFSRLGRKGPRTLMEEAKRRAKTGVDSGKTAEERLEDRRAESRERRKLDPVKQIETSEERIRKAREANEAAVAEGKDLAVERRRKRRAKAGKDPSFMQKFEAGEFDQGKPDTPVKIIPTPEMEMQSNVNTDANKQIAKATDEAIQYHKNTSEKMNQLVELIKTRSESGGLVIS